MTWSIVSAMWRFFSVVAAIAVVSVSLLTAPSAGAAQPQQTGCGGYGIPCVSVTPSQPPAQQPSVTPSPGTSVVCEPGTPDCVLPQTGKASGALLCIGLSLLLVGVVLLLMLRRPGRHR